MATKRKRNPSPALSPPVRQSIPETLQLPTPITAGVGGLNLYASRKSQELFAPRHMDLSWDTVRLMIPAIEYLMAYQGDMSRITQDMETLSASGIFITVLSPKQADINKAHNRLNQFNRRINKHTGGLPGVINSIFLQQLAAGAIANEAELQFENTQKTRFFVKAIHRVDVPTLRIVYESGERVVYQEVDGVPKVKLEAPLFQFQILRELPDGHPYPPLLAAIAEIRRLDAAYQQIDGALQKLGILGILTLQLTQPEKQPKESQQAYNTRLSDYLKAVNTELENGSRHGIISFFDIIKDVKILGWSGEFNNTLGFIKELQRKVTRALDDWLSEDKAHASSWLSVVYERQLQKLKLGQRAAGYNLEPRMLLDLLGAGLTIYDVNIQFSQDSTQFWDKKNKEFLFYKGLIESCGYDPALALRKMGFGLSDEAQFPLQVQDVLQQQWYGVHQSHTKMLYAGTFELAQGQQDFRLKHVTPIDLTRL
jgi:hypothetical protein